MPKLSVRDLDPKGKRIFMRVDFNVPLNDAGEITDDTRIQASLPTIQYLLDRGGRLILASHLGRPKGKPNPKMSLKPAAVRLAQVLGKPVAFAEDCIGPDAEAAAKALKDGEVLLLENLRFHPEEEKNVPEFAQKLAGLAEVYVDDAFGSAHRAHASTEGITHDLSPCVAGLLMEKELEYLGKAVGHPERPYVAIVGGSKVSDKIELLQNMMKFADCVLIGGAMAYTFLKAQGVEVGLSRVEGDKLDLARDLLQFAERRSIEFRLPVDHIVAAKLDPSAAAEVAPTRSIPVDRLGVDIGPATRADYAAHIAKAKTIVWNGPMGVFEIPQFAEGTVAIAHAVADSSAVSVVGGGDSVSAVKKAGVEAKITHISTGGGASLEFLSGLTLPGVAALTEK
ncbi:MAG: phosphoglycerate kinase [Acidobacteriota bacterium]|nr:phosphoglycerate kinase [Acidobacteriota bacterium]